jgi:syntaxin-binding protein 1
MNLKELSKERILNMLRQVNPQSRWKLLVVDSQTLALLNSCCKMSEILSHNVTIVEAIMNKRQPTDMEAIYFISPSIESINGNHY